MLEDERLKRMPVKRRRGQRRGCYNLLAAGFIIGTLLLVIWTVLLVRDPASTLNPFRSLVAPTPTLFVLGGGPTDLVLPATWTPSPTGTVGPTATRLVQATATFTPQSTEIVLATVPVGTPTIAVFPFTLQDSVTFEKNQNGDGCAWMSIAGQIFDLDGNPLTGVGVQVRGEGFEQFEWAGSSTRFGPSGYEVFLNTTPYVANWTIQLLNYNVMPLSDPIPVQSSSSCEQNVAVVNFVQNHEFSR